MGWKAQSEIIAKIREIAPSAFIDKLPLSRDRGVVIRDAPTDSRFRKGPHFDYTFSGIEFFEMVFAPIRQALESNVSTWIECCDVDRFVTAEKRREQIKRKEGRKKGEEKKAKLGKVGSLVPKYKSDTQLCEGGIRNADGTVSRFDIRGITSNSQLRFAIWTFVAEMLLTTPLPMGTAVILHYLHVCPMMFIRNHGTTANVHFKMTQYAHCLGECDHQLPFWARIFSASCKEIPQPIQPAPWIDVRSTDSDLLGTLCDMYDRTPHNDTKTQIFWNRGKVIVHGKRDADSPRNHPLICINTVVDCFVQMNFPVWKLILVAQLFGSDLVLKTDTTDRVGFNTAWPVISGNEHETGIHTILDRIEQNLHLTVSLASRGRKCIWEYMLRSGTPDMRQRFPCLYDNDIFLDEYPEPDGDVTFNRAIEALRSFTWKLPGRRKGKDANEERGYEDALVSLQYYRFPFEIVKLPRPSNFIEKADLKANE